MALLYLQLHFQEFKLKKYGSKNFKNIQQNYLNVLIFNFPFFFFPEIIEAIISECWQNKASRSNPTHNLQGPLQYEKCDCLRTGLTKFYFVFSLTTILTTVHSKMLTICLQTFIYTDLWLSCFPSIFSRNFERSFKMMPQHNFWKRGRKKFDTEKSLLNSSKNSVFITLW